MKSFLLICSLCILTLGCTPEATPPQPFDTTNTPATVKHQDLWDVFVAFHEAAVVATTFDDLGVYLSQSTLDEWASLSIDQKNFMFDFFIASENGDIEYLDSYLLDNEALIYVKYSNNPNEPEDIIASIDMTFENGRWRWQGSFIGNDEIVPALWDATLLSQITTYSTGSVIYNGMAMPVASSLAFIDNGLGEITIMLYPFALTSDDIKEHREGYLSTDLFDRPTPNPAFWPTWAPVAMINLHYEPGTTDYSLQAMTNSCINLNWFEEKNTFNFVCDSNIQASIYQFQLPASPNGLFSFGLNGFNFDSTYQWSITGNASLLTVNHIQ